MSYRLELAEPVPDALRAVAVERLREDHRTDPVEAVHGARTVARATGRSTAVIGAR